MDDLWVVLAALRIAWTFYGQSGYIHPDEFFQSSEIMAGDIFNYEVFRPWEFDKTNALRSAFSPYLTSGVAFYLMKLFEPVAVALTGKTLITARTLLLCPRLVMLLLSFIGDYGIYAIASCMGRNGWKYSLLYASSYVMLVFFSRTLSNAVEAMLFTILLYAVIVSVESHERVKTASRNKDGCRSSSTISQGFADSVVVVTAVVGVFNRPTFLAFLIVPCLVWVLAGGFRNVSWKIISAIPAATVTAFVLIIADSLYYGTLNIPTGELNLEILKSAMNADFLLTNLTLTPWNFVRYNQDAANLASHGVHPRYTHAAVNLPMIVAPLIISCILALSYDALLDLLNMLGLIKNSTKVVYKRRPLHLPAWKKPPKNPYPDAILVLTILTPLGILSVFPHQEMRFLLPLLVPCILLCSRYMTNAFTVVLWILFNISGAVFFGMLHQGGVVPSLVHLHQMADKPDVVIFHRSYMPPRHLLAQPQGASAMSVVDLAGAPPSVLATTLKEAFMKVSAKEKENIENAGCSVMLVTPLQHDDNSKYKNFMFTLNTSFRPHLTMEDPPDFVRLYRASDDDVGTFASNVYDALKLNIYCVEPKSVNSNAS